MSERDSEEVVANANRWNESGTAVPAEEVLDRITGSIISAEQRAVIDRFVAVAEAPVPEGGERHSSRSVAEVFDALQCSSRSAIRSVSQCIASRSF